MNEPQLPQPRAVLPFLLLLVCAPPSAAGKERPPERTFEGTTDVVEVEVPVNVISRDGQPVRGLTAADFTVYDEGRAQEIADLRVVDLEVLEPEAATGRYPELPSAARRHLLFLFDLSFSSPTAIAKARLAARDFVLEALHPTDLAAVATYSLEYGPRLVMTFTPDRAQLAGAIDSLGLYRRRFEREDPLRFILGPPLEQEVFSSGSDQAVDAVRQAITAEQAEADRVMRKHMEKNEKAFERSRISAFSRSMADMARVLDAIPGRTHVIFFSEGVDSRLVMGQRPDNQDQEQILQQLDIAQGRLWMVDTDDLFGNTGLQSDLEEMLEAFRRVDCLIQAVDIAGLRADFTRQSRESVGQESLFFLARATGGELFEDANDFDEQLGRVLRRSAVTYVVTFRPSPVVFDGSYHRLKVEASAPNARVSYRKGYFAPRPFPELDPLEKNLLASDAIASAVPREDVQVEVLVAPFRAGEAAAYVPVILEADGASLLEGHRGEQLPIEIYAYVTDERGQMRDFFTQMVTLNAAAGREPIARTGLKYYGHLELPPGRYKVRVLVRNAETGRSGVKTADLAIPDYTVRGTALLPPFFFEAPGSWILVREKGEGPEGGSVVYPFTVNGDPFVPAARPGLRAGDEARFCLVAYNLGRGDLVLDARVIAADGQAVEGGRVELDERTVTGIEGLDKLLATFRPSGLGLGDYRLEVAVRDPAGNVTHTNSIPFSILN